MKFFELFLIRPVCIYKSNPGSPPKVQLDLIEKAKQAKTEDEILEVIALSYQGTKHTPNMVGYAHAISCFLDEQSRFLKGQWREFAILYYFDILAHCFTPPRFLKDQISRDHFMKFNSIWTKMNANIDACTQSKKGDWEPIAILIFLGFEYLAKLHDLNFSSQRIGNRVKSFMRHSLSLSDEEATALWEFRCGQVHNGTLYNRHKNEIFKYKVSIDPADNRIIYRSDIAAVKHILQGRKYTVNVYQLRYALLEAGRFVHEEMLANPAHYLLNENFVIWIREHWLIQYLMTESEFDEISKVAEQKMKETVNSPFLQEKLIARAKRPTHNRVVVQHQLLLWYNLKRLFTDIFIHIFIYPTHKAFRAMMGG